MAGEGITRRDSMKLVGGLVFAVVSGCATPMMKNMDSRFGQGAIQPRTAKEEYVWVNNQQYFLRTAEDYDLGEDKFVERFFIPTHDLIETVDTVTKEKVLEGATNYLLKEVTLEGELFWNIDHNPQWTPQKNPYNVFTCGRYARGKFKGEPFITTVKFADREFICPPVLEGKGYNDISHLNFYVIEIKADSQSEDDSQSKKDPSKLEETAQLIQFGPAWINERHKREIDGKEVEEIIPVRKGDIARFKGGSQVTVYRPTLVDPENYLKSKESDPNEETTSGIVDAYGRKV